MDKLSTLPDEKYLCKYWEFLNTFSCSQPEKNLEMNRLIDISIPMKNQQPLESMKKRKPLPKEKRENRTTIQNQEAGWTDRDGHTHVQGPLTATFVTLTAYHNIPDDFIQHARCKNERPEGEGDLQDSK